MKVYQKHTKEDSDFVPAGGVIRRPVRHDHFSFVDNRSQTLQRKEIQASIKQSPEISRLTTFQESIHAKMASQKAIFQRKENKTGLPDSLKTGIENLSGYSLDDVKVHYNSTKPAQLSAHAYEQGTDIHLGPRQEKHLPHEAWHVVQQKQRRVWPTLQMKRGVAVNDDKSLEQEADRMGERALELNLSGNPSFTRHRKSLAKQTNIIQRAAIFTGRDDMDSPDRLSRLIRAAQSVGSGPPMVSIKVVPGEAGFRNIQDIRHVGPQNPIEPGDHIDIFGHSRGGYPAGLSYASIISGIEGAFGFEGKWEGDVRIFSCHAAQAGDPKDESTRTIVGLAGAMARSETLGGVRAVGGAIPQVDVNPGTGAIYPLSSENLRLRKALKGITNINQLFRFITSDPSRRPGLAGYFSYVPFTVEELKEAREAKERGEIGTLKAIIHTAIIRSIHPKSGWRIATSDPQGLWTSRPAAFVGKGPGQVRKLASIPAIFGVSDQPGAAAAGSVSLPPPAPRRAVTATPTEDIVPDGQVTDTSQSQVVTLPPI